LEGGVRAMTGGEWGGEKNLYVPVEMTHGENFGGLNAPIGGADNKKRYCGPCPGRRGVFQEVGRKVRIIAQHHK